MMQWYRDLKIAAKLLLSSSLVVALTVALGSFALSEMSSVRDNAQELGQNWLLSVHEIARIRNAIANFRIYEYRHVGSTTREDKKLEEDNLARTLDDLRAAQRIYEPSVSEGEERRLYDEWTSLYEDYLRTHEEIISMSRQQKPETVSYTHLTLPTKA